jgi:predicted phosphohydrolase
MAASPIVFDSAVLRFVCVSDTHNDNCHDQIPDGDVVLYAGDLTDFGTVEELEAALAWILSLPHKIKVIVAGICSALSPR